MRGEWWPSLLRGLYEEIRGRVCAVELSAVTCSRDLRCNRSAPATCAVAYVCAVDMVCICDLQYGHRHVICAEIGMCCGHVSLPPSLPSSLLSTVGRGRGQAGSFRSGLTDCARHFCTVPYAKHCTTVSLHCTALYCTVLLCTAKCNMYRMHHMYHIYHTYRIYHMYHTHHMYRQTHYCHTQYCHRRASTLVLSHTCTATHVPPHMYCHTYTATPVLPHP